jgi:hypothetical protein
VRCAARRVPADGTRTVGQREDDAVLREELLRVELVRRRLWAPFPEDDLCGV